MAYNTTVSLFKLTCIDYMDFGEFQDKFGWFSWSKIDYNYMDVETNVFKEANNKDFRMVQKLTMGEADFNQFMRLRNQLVSAAEESGTDKKVLPMLISTVFKDMDEQLNLAPKVIDVVDPACGKICETLLPYIVEKPDSSYAQVQQFPKKKEDEKFQHSFWMWNIIRK